MYRKRIQSPKVPTVEILNRGLILYYPPVTSCDKMKFDNYSDNRVKSILKLWIMLQTKG